MQREYAGLGCDHNTAFSLLYLDTTYAIRDAIRDGEFSDRTFWNQIADTFGTFYLDSLDAWRNDPTSSRTPEAWRIAFDSARAGDTTTLGDLLLGVNAHVNRDLAFVYYQTGATNYADADHVNEVLARSGGATYADIFSHLDQNLWAQVAGTPAAIDLDLYAWREQAWQNAQRLAAAPDARARATVAAEIEANAVAHAHQIKAAFPATTTDNAQRDAYCATHK